MHVLAPAKLNLSLNVVGRRPDGYHEIDSLFAFCGLSDRLTIARAETLSLDPPEGPFGTAVEPDDGNLVLRAAVLLRAEAGVESGARLRLSKHVPVAAGLGGGSADAAATLLALDAFWGLGWPIDRLHRVAARLGADVPACLARRPVVARGIGERLSPAPALPRCGVLLVNPGVPTPTPAVFKAFRALNPAIAPRGLSALPDRFGDLAALVAAIAPRGNDLLPAAAEVAPAIHDALAALRRLPGAAYSSLSGSGATCFALFETAAAAERAERALRHAEPGWWAWSGGWAESG